MVDVTRSIVVRLPAEVVVRFVLDVESYPDWQPWITSATLLQVDAAGRPERAIAYTRVVLSDIEEPSFVQFRHLSPVSFECSGTAAHPSAAGAVWCEVVPVADGARVTVRRAAPTEQPAGRLLDRMLANLKSVAEAGTDHRSRTERSALALVSQLRHQG